MNRLYLQLFLLANVFLVGVVAALAAHSALAHYRQKHKVVEKPARPAHLPIEVKQQMISGAATQFQVVLNYFVDELQEDMHATTQELTQKLEKMGGDIVDDEMKQYRKSIEDLRRETEKSIGNTTAEIVKHQDDLRNRLAEHEIKTKSRLTKEMNSEKLRLTKQIDTKLADAVAAFLIDSLQHNVDLGAQSPYLTALLEEHKDELLKELGDETTVVK